MIKKKSVRIVLIIPIGLILISCSVCITLIQRSHEVMRISIYYTAGDDTYYYVLNDTGSLYYCYGYRINNNIKITPYIIWIKEDKRVKLTEEQEMELKHMAAAVEENSSRIPPKKRRIDSWDAMLLYDKQVYDINWYKGNLKPNIELVHLIDKVLELSGQTVVLKR